MNTVEVKDIAAASIKITGLNDRKKFDRTKLEGFETKMLYGFDINNFPL